MMHIKLSLLITSLLMQTCMILCSQNNRAAFKITTSPTIETTPIDDYLKSKDTKECKKQILCNKAFDYAWKIPNERPKKKQVLLYQICVHAKNNNHKVDPYFTDNFLSALYPICTENNLIEENLAKEQLSLSCRKKRHAKKIAFCYDFFESKVHENHGIDTTAMHEKQVFTLRDMAEDRFSRK